MKRLLSICLVILLSLYVFPKSDAKEQLSAIQNKYNSAKSMSVNFKQSFNSKGGISGKLMFTKGNKLRVELKNSVIVSDGSSVYNYNASKKQVVINNSDGKSKSFFDLDNVINGYASKCSVSSEQQNGRNVIVLTPLKDSGLDFTKAKMTAGDDNLITRLTIEYGSGSTMEVELTGYELNKNIPDSKFSFIPPEGTKIIDLRK